ncbi:hypothetical protein AB0L57_11985 [Nocardia sp. NPDC052254]|uniref:hypothetical protein n=1 Tax=Nocardia sp. NPDC052254 TaxID=3155681 RepID=UPI0034151775
MPKPARVADLFTDRVPESAVFTAALTAHRAYMDATEDMSAAENVLVYHGVGGIGKTTLSERLEAWSNGESPAVDRWGPPMPVAATCRIDLHPTRGQVDMVAALVSLRRAFGKVEPRWPAFDVAFAAYWSAIRPGEALPGADTEDGAMAEGIADSIGELLSDSGIACAGITPRTVRGAVHKARTQIARHRLFDRYEGFEELVRRCGDLPTPDAPHPELIIDIAHLLDLELCGWEGPHAPQIVVFVDTFERLAADPRRTGEAALNELMWRMPNVLFVVTGRHPLDWYDDTRTNLPAFGRAAWPGLVPGATREPRQHPVGTLASEDCLRIIHRGRELYELDISDPVASELARASDGLPQFLDLALDLARNRKVTGGAPIDLDHVGGSLDELVMRVLADVPADEQRALRAASMFPFFDLFVIGEAAQVDDGCAQRALARPMIDRRGSQVFPYSMHDAIRAAIRNSDHSVPHGWSDRDWRESAEIGLSALHYRHRIASEAMDAEAALAALALAISLVSDQELTIGPAASKVYEDWLSQAIVHGPSIAGLRATLPARAVTEMGRGIADFVAARTTEVTVDQSVELLTGVFESAHPLRLPAGRHRGYVLRDAGRWDEAIAAFDEVIEVSSTPLNCYQRASTFATARRFAEAIDESTGLPAARAESIRITCHASHARFDDYLDRRRQEVEKLWAGRRQREALAGEAATHRWRALLDGRVDRAELDRLHDRAEAAGHLTALRDEYSARLLCDPAAVIPNEDERSWIESVDRARNRGEIGYRTGLIRLAIALYSDDERLLGELAQETRSRRHRRGRTWIPIECVLDSHGYRVDAPPAQWLEPYSVVRTRWRHHFDTWLMRVRG